MSGDQDAADRDDPDTVRLTILRAPDAFDRRDHVMTTSAYQLHLMATAASAARDHPGFVPGGYVAGLTGQDLDSPGTDPAILAAELCTADMWQPTDGGYRVLDWPAVQACIDHVRERRAVDKREPGCVTRRSSAPRWPGGGGSCPGTAAGRADAADRHAQLGADLGVRQGRVRQAQGQCGAPDQADQPSRLL
jgi:hypothetical protein